MNFISFHFIILCPLVVTLLHCHFVFKIGDKPNKSLFILSVCLFVYICSLVLLFILFTIAQCMAISLKLLFTLFTRLCTIWDGTMTVIKYGFSVEMINLWLKKKLREKFKKENYAIQCICFTTMYYVMDFNGSNQQQHKT